MRCLNVKLTYDCNNDCPFCFACELRGERISLPGILHAIEKGYARGCRSLVLSGGEPTLMPSLVMKVLERAMSLDYEHLTLQTNGSGLAAESALGKLLIRIATDSKLSISFSVHGPSAEVHDAICARRGAFSDLMAAMERVAGDTDATILTNSVITQPNVHHLAAIAEVVEPFRVSTMQFSMMHARHIDALSVGLIRSSEPVHALARDVDRETLRTEGIPFCLMYGLEECVGESYWPQHLDLFNRDGDYRSDFDQLADGMRTKLPACSRCIMDEICPGAWAEHLGELAEHAKPIC
jgi:MoaA/NifB/PqqE/SkfB family radical SAM enzyme